MKPRFPPGDLVVLSAVLLTGAALMASLAWAHMSALRAAYGPVCGSDTGRLAHCPACYAAVALFLLGLTSLALARTMRPQPAPRRAGRR